MTRLIILLITSNFFVCFMAKLELLAFGPLASNPIDLLASAKKKNKKTC